MTGTSKVNASETVASDSLEVFFFSYFAPFLFDIKVFSSSFLFITELVLPGFENCGRKYQNVCNEWVDFKNFCTCQICGNDVVIENLLKAHFGKFKTSSSC